ncbi:MAG TPA: hypothetical protein VHK91_02725, partial [Flavisolibacter sp.]|nr:hypothetical protein [Flavisolibacter sp.]
NALLEQLSQQLKNEQRSVVRANPDLSRTIDRSATSSPFSAGDFRMWAEGDNDKETSQPDQADKLKGTFTVRSAQNPSSAIEMMVVIIRPDGRVLKGSEWESGTFETPDGRKVYSAKVVFDYNKGESRKVSFSISGEDFLKGNYTLQIYHNGNLVGQGYRSLF